MASGVIVPVLATTGVAFANDWYNRGTPDLKIPVAGAIAALLGTAFSQVPGLAPVMTSVGWLAFVAVLIAPVQSPPPIANLSKITGGL
jgi:multisubunit Na+/H+ antiporter MnhG subunit